MNSSSSNLKTPTQFTRRQFVGTTAAASAFLFVPCHVLAGSGADAPSSKLNIAGIGLGGMGGANILACANENIVALCDVDHAFAAKSFQAFPKAAIYKDYHVMLEKQKDIDAVLIATPDHTHAVISMAAMRAGKHVFCQKPLTHDIYESHTLDSVFSALKPGAPTSIEGSASPAAMPRFIPTRRW